MLRAHLRELLTTLLWKLTEADSSKYKTRYQSQAAIGRSAGVKLQHEHVYQWARMIDALLEAEPDQIDEILGLAVGCTVTTEEAALLARFDSDYGWERYRKAGITVLDTKHSPARPVDLSGSGLSSNRSGLLSPASVLLHHRRRDVIEEFGLLPPRVQPKPLG